MKNLNELFKKKLAEQQFDGKEKYWAELEKKLNESAQEKVVLAWYKKWLLPVIVVFGIAAAAFLYTQNKDIHSSTQLAQNKNEQPISAQEIVSSTNTKSTKNLNPTTAILAHENLGLESTIENKAQTETLPNTESNLNILATQIPETNSSKKNLNNHSVNSNNVAERYVNKNKNTATEINYAYKEPVLSNNEFVASVANNPASNTTETASEKSNETTQNLKAESAPTLSSNSSINGLDFSKIEMPLALLIPSTMTKVSSLETSANLAVSNVSFKESKSKWNYSLSVYGGAMYSMKNLITEDGNSAEYINRRKSEESNTFKPNLGIDFELKTGHWTLTSGLNFHQQGEKTNYLDEFRRVIPYDSLVVKINNNSAWLVDSISIYSLQYNSVITSSDTTITYYDETSGLYYTALMPLNYNQNTTIDTNFYYLIDSIYNSNIDTLKTNYALKKQALVKDPNQANLKSKNTFSYIEVPILVGYEWGIRRWRLSLKAGLGVGILTRQQSFYLTSDASEIAPVSTDVYTKIMYNGILRAGLHYSFTPAFGIDLVPFTRLNLNNMTTKNATFQQKYSNVGLQVGLNYKLR